MQNVIVQTEYPKGSELQKITYSSRFFVGLSLPLSTLLNSFVSSLSLCDSIGKASDPFFLSSLVL